MTGCWSLLAVFSLIVAPALLLGQNVPTDHSLVNGPGAAFDLTPKLAPSLAPLRYHSLVAPIWIPPPRLPRFNPGPGTIDLQQNVFQQVVHSAGIIFAGRVTFIGHATSSSSPSHASTIITFQVEHSMRGASAGQSLTIHEWAGLWTRGERYRVGERVLLFLYAPSKLGLTSPVGGTMGRFALNSQGEIVMSPQHLAFFAADPISGGRSVVPYADFAPAVRRFQPQRMSLP
jgi:hypothetical protein